MKKLILSLFVLVSMAITAQPIAVKSLGTDTASGLNQQLVVWQLTIDSKAEKVVVVYNIETLSPNGKVVSVGENKTFERYNKPKVINADSTITPGSYKFTELRNSTVGKMIKGMIEADVKEVNSVSDLKLLDQK